MFGLRKPRPAGHMVVAQLNMRLQPMDRGTFEDPLHGDLEKAGLGQITGGGTQMADEPAGIAYCDIEVELTDASEATLKWLVGQFEKMGAPRGSLLHVDGKSTPFGKHEGMGIFLDGINLPDEVYQIHDVDHVIDECNRLLGEKGGYRSYWQGSQETALYFYGPSFTQMKAAVASLLADYPLCRNCRVEQIA
jgi:hypothetical protein